MGNLPIYIYEHAVIVHTDTQSECGQLRHCFQKSQFCSVYTKTGSAAFSKSLSFRQA